ncbi:MAG: hypothetical protein M1822_006069 [Bathelium mastoideum]|nr:MAG: hypothetical protein M1822_006069 [Bathelium mastoideum]
MPSPTQSAAFHALPFEKPHTPIHQRTQYSYREGPFTQQANAVSTNDLSKAQAGLRSLETLYSTEDYQWLPEENNFCALNEPPNLTAEGFMPLHVNMLNQGALSPRNSSHSSRSALVLNPKNHLLHELERELSEPPCLNGTESEQSVQNIGYNTTQYADLDGDRVIRQSSDPVSNRDVSALPFRDPCHKPNSHLTPRLRRLSQKEPSSSLPSHIPSTTEDTARPAASNLSQALDGIRASGFDSLESLLEVYYSRRPPGCSPIDSLHRQRSPSRDYHKNPEYYDTSLELLGRCRSIRGRSVSKVASSSRSGDESPLTSSSTSAINNERLQDESPHIRSVLLEMTRSVIRSNEKGVELIEEMLRRLDKAAGPG